MSGDLCTARRGVEAWQPECTLMIGHPGPHKWSRTITCGACHEGNLRDAHGYHDIRLLGQPSAPGVGVRVRCRDIEPVEVVAPPGSQYLHDATQEKYVKGADGQWHKVDPQTQRLGEADLEQALLRAAIAAADRGDVAGAARLTNAYKRLSRTQGYLPGGRAKEG